MPLSVKSMAEQVVMMLQQIDERMSLDMFVCPSDHRITSALRVHADLSICFARFTD